jgi:hypothetical protein
VECQRARAFKRELCGRLSFTLRTLSTAVSFAPVSRLGVMRRCVGVRSNLCVVNLLIGL